jgi:opacity protein-like surface antigen
MKRWIILALTGATLFGGIAAAVPALAADIMAVKAPAPPPPPSWTGLYFGANVGVGFGQSPFYDIYGPIPDYALDADPSLIGAVGGFQLGYNYQFNWLVLGLQGSFDWAGIQNHFSCFTFGNQTCSNEAEWIASITGRAGIAFGKTLLYVDGGPAWMRGTVSNSAGSAACVPTGGTTVCSAPGDLFIGHDFRDGWTIGGGLEYMLSPNWAVDVQYGYFNFGQQPVTLVDGGTGIFPESVKEEFQLITVGFDYKLTGPTAGAATPWASVFGPGAADETGKTIRAFSILDVGKGSVDGEIGGYFAFSKDLDTSGPRLWVAGGSGWYQFPDSSSGNIRGIYTTGDLLAGYAFEGDSYEINLLAGASAENDMLSAYDASDPVQGTAVGVKVRGDVYYNPTPTSLFYGEGEYSTAFQTYFTSATYGYDIFNRGFFVGPEVTAFGDERFDQFRVGGRISALKYGGLSADISAGFAHDSVVGDGAYGHLELSASF